MRTRVQIDDDLLRALKDKAHREGSSLAKLVNRLLRCGLQAQERGRTTPRRHREKTFQMGVPKVNLDKALALAASLEDDEVREELTRRK